MFIEPILLLVRTCLLCFVVCLDLVFVFNSEDKMKPLRPELRKPNTDVGCTGVFLRPIGFY